MRPWRARRRSEEPELLGSSDGVASTVGAEFAVDHALVGFHGVDRQVQLARRSRRWTGCSRGSAGRPVPARSGPRPAWPGVRPVVLPGHPAQQVHGEGGHRGAGLDPLGEQRRAGRPPPPGRGGACRGGRPRAARPPAAAGRHSGRAQRRSGCAERRRPPAGEPCPAPGGRGPATAPPRRRRRRRGAAGRGRGRCAAWPGRAAWSGRRPLAAGRRSGAAARPPPAPARSARTGGALSVSPVAGPQGGACALPVAGVGAAERVQRGRGELDVRFGRDGLDLGDPPEPAVDALGLAPVERHPGEREVGGDGLRRYRPARFGRALRRPPAPRPARRRDHRARPAAGPTVLPRSDAVAAARSTGWCRPRRAGVSRPRPRPRSTARRCRRCSGPAGVSRPTRPARDRRACAGRRGPGGRPRRARRDRRGCGRGPSRPGPGRPAGAPRAAAGGRPRRPRPRPPAPSPRGSSPG